MPQFEHITYLLGLLVVILLVVLFVRVQKWKLGVQQQLGTIKLIEQLTRNYSFRNFRLKNILVLVAIAMGIIALANLRLPVAAGGITSNGIDVVFALDISKSMLSEDEKPSRLNKAKLLINQLSENLNNNRVGLVLFAGQAYLQMPLTPDASAARMFVNNASPEMISVQGTVIGDAIQVSDIALNTKEKKSKAIILITDGENHDDKAEAAVKQLAEHGTALFTVGVGSVEGSPIIEPGTNEYKRNIDGETVISKLNDELLKNLAKAGNGTYYHLSNTTTTASELLNALNALEKKPIQQGGTQASFFSLYPFFLFITVALLMIELFISERKRSIA